MIRLSPALPDLAATGRALGVVLPALLYLAGLVALVIAAFLFCRIAGFAALGCTLIVIGYMVEVNQSAVPRS